MTSTPGGITASGSTSPVTVPGLTNGTAYTFKVTATNGVGTSAASAASNSVTPATVSGAPTIGSATAGNANASVTFTAPSSDGGSAITSYTVTSTPGGITASGSTSPVTVPGLTNGTAYTFKVTATNGVGTSAASAASNSVTPAFVPHAYFAADYPSSSFNQTVFVCGVDDSGDSNNGTVADGCTQTDGDVGAGNWVPESVVTESHGSYAYVADGNEKLWACAINPDGTFGHCASTPTPDYPDGMSIGTVNGTNYLFVTTGGNDIFSCPISSDGSSIGTCSDLTGFSWSSGIASAVASGTTYVYVSDPGNDDPQQDQFSGVYRCPFNSNGTWGSCSDAVIDTSLYNYMTAHETFWIPVSMTVASVSGGTFAYFADAKNNYLYICTITTTGSGFNVGGMGNCAPSSVTLSGEADGESTGTILSVAIEDSSPFLYVGYTTGSNNGYQKCAINTSTGALSCSAGDTSLSSSLQEIFGVFVQSGP